MWDQRYSETGFAYGTLANDYLKLTSGQLKPKGQVLCLAEGEGRNAVYLAQQGFEVTAVDISSVGLNKAQQLATQAGVTINTVQADLSAYPLGEEAWDGIVSIFAHMPAAIRQSLHAKVAAALKPQGLFILEAYTPQQLKMPGQGGPTQAAMLMSKNALKQELSGLNFVESQEIQRHVNEGKYHNGLSAVVQIIACRA